MFAEQLLIFRKNISLHRTDTIFSGGYVCSPTGTIFSEAPFWLLNRYHFQEHSYNIKKWFGYPGQILIFQEAFFEYQRTDMQFPGRYRPLRADFPEIGLGGCFRN